ncbi:MAG: M23 family metallopeptidase [Clostridia bacterium]|nr:M23 family metallopeptidase [Clostridia bacterium]
MDYDFQQPQREERDEYRNRFKFTDEDAPKRNGPSKSKPKTKTDYLIRLILLQGILSILIVSGVFLASKISPNFFAEMKEDYGRIMQTDMSAGDIASQLKEAAEFVLKPVQSTETDEEIRAVMAQTSENISVTSYEVTSDETGETIAVGEMVNGSGGDDTESAKGTSFASYFVNADPIIPVQGARITSRFGYRTHPITGKYGFHTGLDLAAAEGTPISSVFYGKVTKTGEDDSWGKYVLVEHSDGFETFYCHLSEIYVENGAVIRQGETVGLVGSTGMSTGPHLHFEVRINGIRVDPELLLYPENADEA